MSDFNYLKTNWEALTGTDDVDRDDCFNYLVQQYTSPARYYHTLEHVAMLLRQIDAFSIKLEHPELLRWAAWYHDVIYDVNSSDNEEQSAVMAGKYMMLMGVDDELINKCTELIRATKTHAIGSMPDSFDARFFLDIDLMILGSERSDYIDYLQKVRLEFLCFPNDTYIKGRKKYLGNMLSQEDIFLSSLFSKKYESVARANIQFEIDKLEELIKPMN